VHGTASRGGATSLSHDQRDLDFTSTDATNMDGLRSLDGLPGIATNTRVDTGLGTATLGGSRSLDDDQRDFDTTSTDATSGSNLGAATPDGFRSLDDDHRDLDFVLAPSPTPASSVFAKLLPPHLDAAEVCPSGISFVQTACGQIAASGGAALIIDYGIDGPPQVNSMCVCVCVHTHIDR